MNKPTPSFAATLFQSYCHADAEHQQRLEVQLAQLKRDGLVRAWSDRSIVPGSSISASIDSALLTADIVAFLISPDFLASAACVQEWEKARELATSKPLLRIPIIVRACEWQQLLDCDDVKALPNDGEPITRYSDPDDAWCEVSAGLRQAIQHMRETFTPLPDFIRELNETEFFSQQHLRLDETFVFPVLTTRPLRPPYHQEDILDTREALLGKERVLVHGPELSGKTALARHVFLSLVDDPATPVLYIDLAQRRPKPNSKFLRVSYESQFTGDYDLWERQQGKTLIIDHFTARSSHVRFVEFVRSRFDRILIMVSSAVYESYYRDDSRIADYVEVRIEPLTHGQQEALIRRRLALSSERLTIPDGRVDQVEDRVNSVIMSQRLVPRYPFFVLSILQSLEAFMPSSFAVTSYGHCYKALILARLIKAGISARDSDINPCLNFAEHLAFQQYHAKRESDDGAATVEFEDFVEQYRQRFHISDSTLSRLRDREYGLLEDNGEFRANYSYYYFLGMYLAKHRAECADIVELICGATYLPSNYLTLLFLIHHTESRKVIDEILLRTLCALEGVEPATLDRAETGRFRQIVGRLPKNVLSGDSVEDERRRERERRDAVENNHGSDDEADWEDASEDARGNAIYSILKNNEIVGQILRNQYGLLERTRIQEIVEIVADSGLRLVNVVLKDETEIEELARFVKEKFPDEEMDRILRILRALTFIWTGINVNRIVDTINVPEIRESVDAVVSARNNPAYDVIGYFYLLDSAEELTEVIRNRLKRLLKKHDDQFIRWVLAFRTQHYVNTHKSDYRIEQSVLDLLGLKKSLAVRLRRT